jgi:hypothetical protein
MLAAANTTASFVIIGHLLPVMLSSVTGEDSDPVLPTAEQTAAIPRPRIDTGSTASPLVSVQHIQGVVLRIADATSNSNMTLGYPAATRSAGSCPLRQVPPDRGDCPRTICRHGERVTHAFENQNVNSVHAQVEHDRKLEPLGRQSQLAPRARRSCRRATLAR